MIERLQRAANARDLDALVDCFTPGYVNETPAHPERGFRGRDQVRRNWERIFATVGDLEVEVLRHVTDGDTVWSEWEHRGTRPDGSPHLMRGVVIFGVEDDRAAWGRFYLEPVEHGGPGVDAALARHVGGAP
ncbi:nuclear transport factor 2 family protein [Lentzea kentuckyensis]|uniref:nuclear transport factor 2 family protein n=1 Tax=Lentzea kentuckyensis TaxID=360086 RepID=UPI000A3CA1A6